MKVAIVTSTFSPDHTGIAVYSTDFARLLQEAGHEVTVLTTFAHYPHWKKQAPDVGVLFREECLDGLRVLRGYSYIPATPSTLKRILHDASFTLFALLNALRVGGVDLAIGFSPPITSGIVCQGLKLGRAARVVSYVQDLQLEAAVGLGMLSRGWLTKAIEALDRWLLRRADHVVTVSRSMKRRIVSKGVPSASIAVVQNWIDVESSSRPTEPGSFRRRFPELGNAPLVGYAGNLGVKQNLQTLLHAARILAELGSDTKLVIVGDGAVKGQLMRVAAELGLTNTHFLPTQTPQQYQELLGDLEIFVLPQSANANDVFFPSKLLGILARRVPLIVSADQDSELGRAATSSGGAVCVPAADSAALASAIERLHRDADLRRCLSESSREFLEAFDRSKVLENAGGWITGPQAGARDRVP